MRAIAISEFGAMPELVDLPTPVPGPDDVLVQLRAAGFNPVDVQIADGAFKDSGPHSFPMVLGLDGAGVVAEVGNTVTRFRPGDQVYGQFQKSGSYAEYGLAAQDAPIARMPIGMIFTQAAAVPTSSMTAFNMVEIAKVDEGQRVLVVGATGGVGQSIVQLAATVGAEVIATATSDMTDYLRGLGADEIVDHTAGPLADQVLAGHPDGIDVVLDVATPNRGELDKLAGLVRPGGVVVTARFSADPEALAAREIRGINFQNTASAELLETLADLIDAGKLRVRIDAEIPLDQVPEMMARSRSGRARGKTVIRVS